MRDLQRMFLALKPDVIARRALSGMTLPADARRVHADDLHLTLAFLGTLDATGMERAFAAASALSFAPVTVRLRELEYWPDSKVICAVADAGDESLAALAAGLDARLADSGLGARDLVFRPHVTLARAAPTSSLRLAEEVSWEATEIALMGSRAGALAGAVTGDGPRYSVVGSTPLGG